MNRARRLRLNAADASLLALDRFMDGGRVGKNLVHLVVELEGEAPERDRLADVLDRFLDASPWPAARLRRGLPLFAPYWCAQPRDAAQPPVVREHTVDVDDDNAWHRFLEDKLDERIDPFHSAPVRFEVVRAKHAGGTHAVVLTWFHPLMDPRGAETFLAQLDLLDRGEAPDCSTFEAPPPVGKLSDRLQLARSGKKYLDSFRASPPRSPAHDAEPAARARFRRATFVARDPADRRRSEMTWRLAVAGRALQRVFGGDDPYVLPISVDLRKKGENGPVFGNHLSLHFAQFAPDEDPDATVRALRMQMVEAMKDQRIEATMAAIHLIRGLPVSLLAKRMASSTRGQLASFHFADTGEYRGAVPTFFGAHVRNAYHIPTVTPKPGLGVFINRHVDAKHGDRENIVVGWREGAAQEHEVKALIEDLRESFGWDRA